MSASMLTRPLRPMLLRFRPRTRPSAGEQITPVHEHGASEFGLLELLFVAQFFKKPLGSSLTDENLKEIKAEASSVAAMEEGEAYRRINRMEKKAELTLSIA